MKKIILALFLISCNKQSINIGNEEIEKTGIWKKYTIPQGSHYSYPISNQVLIGNSDIKAEFKFTDQSRYYLYNVDSLDWNKLFGFKLDYNSIPNHAAMVAWRYSKVDSLWEVAPYFNDNGIIFPDTNEIIKVDTNKVIFCRTKLQGSTATIWIEVDTLQVMKQRTLVSGSIYSSVSIYFGGNQVAPNKIEIWKRKL